MDMDKGNLIGAAVNLDSAMYLMQDLTEDFFVRYNPDKAKDLEAIRWEFSRYRAITQAIFELLFNINRDYFEKYDITPYD